MDKDIQEYLNLLKNDFADYIPYRPDELNPRSIYLDLISKIEYYILKEIKND